MHRLGLGERLRHTAEQLSTGERQRVMIARALSTEPARAAGGRADRQPRQPPQPRRDGLLAELCHERDVATLLVTHDPLVAGYADRALELHDGRLRAYVADAAQAVKLSNVARSLRGCACARSWARSCWR